MYTNKPLEELDVMDDFLFSAIAADREVGEAFCRKLLSVLLGRKIGKIRVTAQHTRLLPHRSTAAYAWTWKWKNMKKGRNSRQASMIWSPTGRQA